MTKCEALRGALLALVVAVFAPGTVYAQGGAASITGVVKDASGAVLPGVTVEASSPALIEKVRSVVSAGNGQYRIVNLQPGVYAVTFTLAGFSTFKREGIELTGNFTATIDAEMKVGAQEETITVTGQAPIVDVQGVARQAVISKDIVENIPTGMYYTNIGLLVPGVSVSCTGACSGSSQDVGGTGGDSRSQLVSHGSRFRDQRLYINGMNVSGSTGGVLRNGPNMAAMQETQIETSAIDSSMSTGGVRINLVPKEGGNAFGGGVFATFTNSHFQANNISQALIDRGLKGAESVKSLYEVAPSFGGPVKKDKLWFFGAFERNAPVNYVPGKFFNLNAGDPTSWTYSPDPSRPATEGSRQTQGGGRLTWQATAKNKFAFSYDRQYNCICLDLRSGSSSVEAAQERGYGPDSFTLATWSSPVTNRLLIEAGAMVHEGNITRLKSPYTIYDLTQVTEQSPPASWGSVTTYRGSGHTNDTRDPYRSVSATMTYVTGGHAFKTGFSDGWGYNINIFPSAPSISNYTFNNGKPVSFAINTQPYSQQNNIKAEAGVFVQDKWTIKRLTLSGGVRYDYVNKYSPQQSLGPSPILPARNVTFPQTSINKWSDVSPRLGVALDLFGNGKTAVKVTLNRYLEDASLGSGSNVFVGSPINLYQFTASRSWTDGNGNFLPDCDYTNPAAQNNLATGGDFCGAFTGNNVNFGSTRAGTTVSNDVQNGFGHRGFNWEYSTAVQQQITSRLAVDVGYFRRWFGNFTITDNLAVSASNYDPFSVTVPTDPRLPLSGQTINGFLNINPNVASLATNNVVSHSTSSEGQYEHWQGVDFNVTSRFQGLTLQGGISTGKTVRDNCGVLAQAPESGITTQQSGSADAVLLTIAGPLANPFCHQDSGFLTQGKLLGSYTIPRVDVLVSAAFQSIPGPMLTATLVVPSATAQTTGGLGRPLSGGAANVTVNIVAPGSLYGDRLNQLDFRVGKVLRFGAKARVTPSIDIFNVFNTNAVLIESSNYTTFRQPQDVAQGRLAKFTVVFSF